MAETRYKLVLINGGAETDGIPYKEFLDMKLVCLFSEEENSSEFYPLKYSDMTRLGLTEEEVFRKGLEGRCKETPVFCPMTEYIKKMEQEMKENFVDEDISELPEIPDSPFWVYTNESNSIGATLIVIPGAIEVLKDKFPDGFIAIPDSIHSWLLLDKHMRSRAEVATWLHMANMFKANENDILSFEPYYDTELEEAVRELWK